VKRAKGSVNRIAITKARTSLGAVARRAHEGGEYFILEKDGIPVAGIMSADELEDYLELRNPAVQKQIGSSRRDVDAGRTRSATELLEELRNPKGVGRRKTV